MGDTGGSVFTGGPVVDDLAWNHEPLRCILACLWEFRVLLSWRVGLFVKVCVFIVGNITTSWRLSPSQLAQQPTSHKQDNNYTNHYWRIPPQSILQVCVLTRDSRFLIGISSALYWTTSLCELFDKPRLSTSSSVEIFRRSMSRLFPASVWQNGGFKQKWNGQ